MLHLSAEWGTVYANSFRQSRLSIILKSNVIISAVYNIDHNPSSTTAKYSFHGTGISLIQQPTFADEGVHCGSIKLGGNGYSKTVNQLPSFYTDIPPTSGVKGTTVSDSSMTSLKRKDFKKHTEREYEWLENGRHALEENSEISSLNVSSAAYQANYQPLGDRIITP